jgi:hypothetical protein
MAKPHTHDEAAGDLPEFLCRLCHPELNLSPERRHELERDERKALAKETKRAGKARELAAVERKVAALSAKRHQEGTVSFKILKSQERKAQKLRADLDR